MKERLTRVDWWAVSCVLFLVAALAITIVDLLDGKDLFLYRNLVGWLGTAAVVSALFSLRESLGALRLEQVRRAYDPDFRKRG